MRRCLALFLLFPMVFFCSCRSADRAMQETLDFRTTVLQSGGCNFDAAVTAEAGECSYDFCMTCAYDGEDAHFTVTEPENISGICGRVRNEQADIDFEDIALEFPVESELVSPVKTGKLLGDAWARDYISAAGADGELCRMTAKHGYDEDELTVDTWLREKKPVYAEISYNGKTLLSCKIDNFCFGFIEREKN